MILKTAQIQAIYTNGGKANDLLFPEVLLQKFDLLLSRNDFADDDNKIVPL